VVAAHVCSADRTVDAEQDATTLKARTVSRHLLPKTINCAAAIVLKSPNGFIFFPEVHLGALSLQSQTQILKDCTRLTAPSTMSYSGRFVNVRLRELNKSCYAYKRQ
jgi:hypothetical protein